MEKEKPDLVQITNENKPTTEPTTLVEILRNSPLIGLNVDFSRQGDELRSFVFDDVEEND